MTAEDIVTNLLDEVNSLKSANQRLNAQVESLLDTLQLHTGPTFGPGTPFAPHPNQQISTAEFGEGFMRLDEQGVQFLTDFTAGSKGIFWRPTASGFYVQPADPTTAASKASTIQMVGDNAGGREWSLYSYSSDPTNFAFVYANQEGSFSEAEIGARHAATASIFFYADSGGERRTEVDGPLRFFHVAADDAILYDGELWYRSDLLKFRARVNSVTENLALESWVTSALGSYILKSIGTAKGDIIVFTASGTPTNKAAPANDSIFMADSAQPDGWKAVAPATPVAITPDAAAAAGSSDDFTRGDHQHGVATYSSTPAADSGAGSAGTSATAPSRGDHAHPVSAITALTAGNWKVFYSNGSGVVTEVALGAANTVLTSNGASSAPTFAAPSSGWAPATIAKSGTYTAVANDVVLATAGAGGFTVTLPAASSNTNAVIMVKKVDNGAGNITVGRTGSDTIDGATSYTIRDQYVSFSFISDGTNWYAI